MNPSVHCPITYIPIGLCTCFDCEAAKNPITERVPEFCKETYYGIPCTYVACQKTHKLPRKKTEA